MLLEMEASLKGKGELLRTKIGPLKMLRRCGSKLKKQIAGLFPLTVYAFRFKSTGAKKRENQETSFQFPLI